MEGGIRSVEIGFVMLAYPHPQTGKVVYPQLELVRLAIPRRVYTASHFDYVIETIKTVANRATSLKGYHISFAPELMRHFTARSSRSSDQERKS